MGMIKNDEILQCENGTEREREVKLYLAAQQVLRSLICSNYSSLKALGTCKNIQCNKTVIYIIYLHFISKQADRFSQHLGKVALYQKFLAVTTYLHVYYKAK